jgi:CubicO group peptidase (beta-lactamase class C family)
LKTTFPVARFLAGFVFLFLGTDSCFAAQLPLRAVQEAADYSMRHAGLSFLVIQDGRTLLERYAGGTDAGTALRIYSGTKAFWNLAALAAAEDGALNLDGRVSDVLPQWPRDAHRAPITIRKLLNFDSGLEPTFSLQEDQSGDRDDIAIRASMAAQPGAAFIYGPASLQVFHAVLKKKLQSPTRFLKRRVLHRLGLDSQRYLEDRAGNPLLASGFVLTARQWSKLGEMVLRAGAPVISPPSLAQCWHGSQANPMFALGWWNNRAAARRSADTVSTAASDRGYNREIDVEQMLARKWQDQDWRDGCLCRDAPADLVACIGSGHQRLYVIPSLRLIVVRQGDGGSFSDGDFLRLLLHGLGS